MKTGATLLFSAFLAAICGSFVDANGVCYDPNHVGVENKNAGTVAKDIEAMRSKGFTFVRTYISKFGNTDMVKQIAKAGMQVAAGVPYDEGDYATQLEAALSAAKDGNVLYIMIGNENLARYGAVPDRMVAEIQRVKGLAPPGVKVGTVQRNTEFLNNMPGLAGLISACDVIGVNIHPFFTGGQDGSNAIELTKTHWNKALAMAGDKLILGETGWPSDGQFAGNKGTPASASSYFSAYKAWSAALPAHKKFYFQMFDQPTKADLFEQTYGIVKADSSDKFGASVPASGPVAVPTPAPVATTQAPAPTTAAPTATPKPPATANATTPSSGSLDKASKTKTAGSAAGSATGSLADAGSVSKLTSSSTTTDDDALKSDNETGADADATTAAAATAATAARTSVDTPLVPAKDSTNYAGGNNDKTTDANTQSVGGSGSAATVMFAVVAGCMAVVAAFGFIYRTRKKAAELEEAESKESFSMTPHGGCVL